MLRLNKTLHWGKKIPNKIYFVTHFGYYPRYSLKDGLKKTIAVIENMG